MTTYTEQSLFDRIVYALVGEPMELIASQPHQALISVASVSLVSAEAALLVGWPANMALAVGAEWAYLKGLSSGQRVHTRWVAALNVSAILLVVVYGSLWSLRKFGMLPNDGFVTGDGWERWAAAIILTACHILTIGAVTISSAMVHAAEAAADRVRKEREQQRIAEEAEHERQRQRDLQAQRDALALEAERNKQALTLEWQRSQLRREARAINAAHQIASAANANNAVQERIHANHATNAKCPHCDAPLKNMAAVSAAHRWGHCAQCKKEKK